MLSAATLRRQIESTLEQRIPGALTPRPRTIRDVATTGIPELDTLLQGGLPVGAITELVGPQCSGRTTLALAFLAEQTIAGKVVAWVDASDALDPESAAAAGVDLSRQLWVRCGGTQPPAHPTQPSHPHTPSAQRPGPPMLVEGNHVPAPAGSCGSTHPRTEVHGLSQAIGDFMQPDTFARPTTPRSPSPGQQPAHKNRTIGTPGAPNRKLSQPAWADNRNNAAGRSLQSPPSAIAKSLDRTQQMAARASGQGHGMPRGPFDWKPALAHLNAAPNTPQPAENALATPASLAGDPPSRNKQNSPIWKALDQALRATDLLLAGGGFSTIVIDLGSIPPEFAWRIPLATWFRFRAAAERARTVLLVLTQHPCTRSSAELVLRLSPAQAQSTSTVLTGAGFHIAIDRQRFESNATPPQPSGTEAQVSKLHLVTPRKPPQRERATPWQRSAAWVRAGQRQGTR